MKPVHVLLLLGSIPLSVAAFAAEVRTVQLASHSLFPSRDGFVSDKSAQDAAALKPHSPQAPSPILVHYRASIDTEGGLVYGCESAPVRDFRAKQTLESQREDRR